MKDVNHQKIKLEQKKNRLAAEELKLKFKERKARTRNLIELGGLIIKAELDNLPANALYGALLTLKDTLDKDDGIQAVWIVKGNAAFNKETKARVAIVLKFKEQPESIIRNHLREHGLMWNRFRQEWYGYCDTKSLEEAMMTLGYQWTSSPVLPGESTSLNKERDGQNMKYVYVQILERE